MMLMINNGVNEKKVFLEGKIRIISNYPNNFIKIKNTTTILKYFFSPNIRNPPYHNYYIYSIYQIYLYFIE
jgi:hypothetical protein